MTGWAVTGADWPLAMQLQVFPCILAEQRGVLVVEGQLQVPLCAISVRGTAVSSEHLGDVGRPLQLGSSTTFGLGDLKLGSSKNL